MIYFIAFIALVLVAAVLGFNSLARIRNVVRSAWADIDVQLKRRADLVPNLVETAKGYSGFERAVLEEVTEARSRVSNEGLSPAARADAEGALADRITRVIAIAESYPELKASANFIRLQDELSNTENKLASARQYYNAAVRDLNTMTETFPLRIIAGLFGFKRAEFFNVDNAEDREAPSARIEP
jgi:LemA protein